MTERGKDKNLKTRYEFLIAGIVALLLCIVAFAAFKITGYLTAAKDSQVSEITIEPGDGTVLIEVAIRETTAPSETEEEPVETEPVEEPIQNVINEHDDITIFTATPAGENYYKSKNGRLKLYADPKETDEERPSLMEDAAFEVLGFSIDGWAAIQFGGTRYYVKSADIIPTDTPEDWEEKHVEPEDSQAVRFFTPNSGDIEYVVTYNARAFSLPDVMSSGNYVDLKAGERVIVVATGDNWFKIIYMNAEYYILNYIKPRTDYVEENPEEEIIDNTGYAPAGSPEAAASASSSGASDTANSGGTATDGYSDPDSSGESDSSGGDSGSGYGYGMPVYELLDYVNAERTAAGLEPLTWSGELEYCACVRAGELMYLTNEQNADHLRPDGSEWYTVSDYTYAENIAYGQRSVYEVHSDWVSSQGHYENMMREGYRTFGAALYQTDDGYGYYWIEEFGY